MDRVLSITIDTDGESSLLEELLEKDSEDAPMIRELFANRNRIALSTVILARATALMDPGEFIRAMGEGEGQFVLDACMRSLELQRLAYRVKQELRCEEKR